MANKFHAFNKQTIKKKEGRLNFNIIIFIATNDISLLHTKQQLINCTFYNDIILYCCCFISVLIYIKISKLIIQFFEFIIYLILN